MWPVKSTPVYRNDFIMFTLALRRHDILGCVKDIKLKSFAQYTLRNNNINGLSIVEDTESWKPHLIQNGVNSELAVCIGKIKH